MFTTSFIFFALQLLAAASPVYEEHEGGMKIALGKRSTLTDDGIANIDSIVDQISSAERKFQLGLAAYKRNTGEDYPFLQVSLDVNLTRRATGAVPLTDDNNGELWHGAIFVGTPPVSYTVDFDTGSSDLFLPGPTCKTNCAGHKIYNPPTSSTSHDRGKTYKLGYGDGSSVSGEQYTDTVQISGLIAKNQTLGDSSTYSAGFGGGRFPPDGLLGMAYQTISQYNSPPVFQSLVAQNQSTQPVFSFKLAKTGAELFLGGVNSKQYAGPITYTPVVTKGYWQVPLAAVTANSEAPVTNVQAIIDTGTTLIIGPSGDVGKFYASIRGSKDVSSAFGPGYYTVPCSSIPKVSFTFGGQAFSISPASFNLGLVKAGSKDCVGAIVASSSFNFWVVGDVFLQNVYSVFDLGNNRVGFAALS